MTPSDVTAAAVGQHSHTRASTSVSDRCTPSAPKIAARTVIAPRSSSPCPARAVRGRARGRARAMRAGFHRAAIEPHEAEARARAGRLEERCEAVFGLRAVAVRRDRRRPGAAAVLREGQFDVVGVGARPALLQPMRRKRPIGQRAHRRDIRPVDEEVVTGDDGSRLRPAGRRRLRELQRRPRPLTLDPAQNRAIALHGDLRLRAVPRRRRRRHRLDRADPLRGRARPSAPTDDDRWDRLQPLKQAPTAESEPADAPQSQAALGTRIVIAPRPMDPYADGASVTGCRRRPATSTAATPERYTS